MDVAPVALDDPQAETTRHVATTAGRSSGWWVSLKLTPRLDVAPAPWRPKSVRVEGNPHSHSADEDRGEGSAEPPVSGRSEVVGDDRPNEGDESNP